jgi:hypothetical protein
VRAGKQAKQTAVELAIHPNLPAIERVNWLSTD